ncbi:MAG: peptidase [Verrucomicrobiales bacterium]|nr:peptidase [Verrucomicrobiales bacterium]
MKQASTEKAECEDERFFMFFSLSVNQLPANVALVRKLKLRKKMKITKFVRLFAVALLAGAVSFSASAKDQKALEAEAKISKADAEKIALEKVPGGKIKEGGLEEEKGKLIWSFDIATKGSKNITEIAIDAKTGEIIAVDVETPKDEAKEAKVDAHEKKQKALEAKAKLSKADAEKIALKKVPGGKIREGELEEEKGKLIWSFDVATDGSKNITEVNIDAITGKVIAVDVETPKDEAKEAKADAKEKKAAKKGKKQKTEKTEGDEKK